MISICLTRFPISGLGKPKLYQNMWCFTRKWGILLGSLFGECYYIVFGSGLVVVKPQPNLILFSPLVMLYQ